MVVFQNGKPYKSGYRKFKIKSFEGADDYSAMREVIYRRFRNALEEEELIDIDEVQSNIARLKGEIAKAEKQLEEYLRELGL